MNTETKVKNSRRNAWLTTQNSGIERRNPFTKKKINYITPINTIVNVDEDDSQRHHNRKLGSLYALPPCCLSMSPCCQCLLLGILAASLILIVVIPLMVAVFNQTSTTTDVMTQISTNTPTATVSASSATTASGSSVSTSSATTVSGSSVSTSSATTVSASSAPSSTTISTASTSTGSTTPTATTIGASSTSSAGSSSTTLPVSTSSTTSIVSTSTTTSSTTTSITKTSSTTTSSTRTSSTRTSSTTTSSTRTSSTRTSSTRTSSTTTSSTRTSSTTTSSTTTVTTGTTTACLGSYTGNLANINGGPTFAWTQFANTYTANTTQPYLSFGFENSNHRQWWLDGISVIDVSASSVNLLNNPSFENSSTALTGWYVQYGCCNINALNINTSGCIDGNNCVNFFCGPEVTFSFMGQYFNAIIGHIYNISYYLKTSGTGGQPTYCDVNIS